VNMQRFVGSVVKHYKYLSATLRINKLFRAVRERQPKALPWDVINVHMVGSALFRL